jgi:hypothetical protein
LNIFILCLGIIGLMKLVLSPRGENLKLFTILSGLLLFLIGALRNIRYLYDTLGYAKKFLELPLRPLYELWLNSLRYIGKDPFFYFIAKLISLLRIDYQGWIAILFALFCFTVFLIIYKYSDEIFLSIFAFISLGYFSFGLTGLRQTVAISFTVLSYKYLRERRLAPFIALVLVATLFHSSALIFIIAYPLSKIKIGWKQIAGIGGAIIMTYFFSDFFRFLIARLGWTDSLTVYAQSDRSLSLFGLFIQMITFLFCLYYKKNVVEKDEDNTSLYNLLFLGVVFQAFAVVVAEMFRISMYFSIFAIILIPKAVFSEKDRQVKPFIYFGVFLVLAVMFMYSKRGVGYTFFWQ